MQIEFAWVFCDDWMEDASRIEPKGSSFLSDRLSDRQATELRKLQQIFKELCASYPEDFKSSVDD